MSKKLEKGRRGEHAVTAALCQAATHEQRIEVRRATKTSERDKGRDITLNCPHNFGDKLDDIVKNGNSERVLSKSDIAVRADVKNHNGKITKATAEKFTLDIDKNPDFAEHWLIGGNGITKGAKEVLEDANKNNAPVRYFSNDDMDIIQSAYPARPLSKINNNG